MSSFSASICLATSAISCSTLAGLYLPVLAMIEVENSLPFSHPMTTIRFSLSSRVSPQFWIAWVLMSCGPFAVITPTFLLPGIECTIIGSIMRLDEKNGTLMRAFTSFR